jgi:hypothetical protein
MNYQDLPPNWDREERVLNGLMAMVPRRTASPGFSSRLMTVTRQAWPAGADGRFWNAARSELAISAGVVGGAALLTLIPVVLIAAAFIFDASIVVNGTARACVLLVQWLSAGLSMWDVLARAARITATAIASPIGTFILLGGVLTASLALAGLSRVLPGERGEL